MTVNTVLKNYFYITLKSNHKTSKKKTNKCEFSHRFRPDLLNHLQLILLGITLTPKLNALKMQHNKYRKSLSSSRTDGVRGSLCRWIKAMIRLRCFPEMTLIIDSFDIYVDMTLNKFDLTFTVQSF